MSTHELFQLESRTHGDDGHKITHAKIECGTCHRVLWKPARDSGIAIRVFRSAGWLVGSRRATDVCPGCRNQKPKRPDLTGPQRRAAYIAIEKRKVAALDAPLPMPPEVTKPPLVLETPVPVFSSPLREPITPVIPPEIGAKLKEVIAAVENEWPTRVKIPGMPKSSATTGYSQARNAMRTARAWCFAHGVQEPIHGIHYYVLPSKDGFLWKDAAHTSAYERSKWKKTRVSKPYAIPSRRKQLQQITPPERTEPMATTDTAVERTMTRDERRRIVDFLDRQYDQQHERWRGKGTDEAASMTLDLPRAWVAQIRVEQFGDHDRNEFASAQTAKIDEAIAVATAAYDRLLVMATEADQITQALKLARSKLNT